MSAKREHRRYSLAGYLRLALLLLAIHGGPPHATFAETPPPTPPSSGSQQLTTSIPFQLPAASEVRRIKSAVLYTDKGSVAFELFPEVAPIHVANLKYLADRGFFRGKTVDGFYPNQLVQLGAPLPSEAATYRYTLPPEFSDRDHSVGALGMARSDNPKLSAMRRSLPTQVHILLRANSLMNGDYTVFGRVIRGMGTVRKLTRGTVIKDFVVYVVPPS